MIIVYPMLISPNISPHAVPGIVKAVEKYILVYNLDDVINQANSFLRGVYSTGKGAVQLGVQAGAIILIQKYGPLVGKALGFRVKEEEELFIFREQHADKPWWVMTDREKDEARKKSEEEKRKGDLVQTGVGKDKGAPQTRVEMPRKEGISLEPTWVQVQSDALGSKVLGVKVVPFTVKSSENLMTMISYDAMVSGLERSLEGMKRSLIRVFYGILKFFRKGTLTGNPKHDVIWAATKHGQNMFICINTIDVEQEDMFSKPQVVNQLHRLGWASIIIADDVNKKATFCMKEFSGLCSTVPYGLLFSAIGKEQYEVYQNISDVKHSAGPFFRFNAKRNKIFENDVATQAYNKYSGGK